MNVCLLTLTEAARLERNGIWPKCRNHRHLNQRETELLLAADTHRYIGGEDTAIQGCGPLTMITEQTSNEYEWRNRPSGGFLGAKVRQFVPAR